MELLSCLLLLFHYHFGTCFASSIIETSESSLSQQGDTFEAIQDILYLEEIAASSKQLQSHEYSLSDPPIQGSAIRSLNNNEQYRRKQNAASPLPKNAWKLDTGQPGRILDAKIPGDLLTDLVNAGVWDEPYFENNFLASYFCDDEDGMPSWVYRLRFNITTDFLLQPSKGQTRTTPSKGSTDPSDIDGEVLLVFDGIKMGARIDLNNNKLGVVTDQFLRYRYPVKDLLKWNHANLTSGESSSNVLKITFDSNILTDGRFSACSGGWDWAPFSNCPRTNDTHSHQYTKGITKSVYLTRVSSAAITAMVPEVYYMGDYPTQALQDGNHSGFEVQVTIYLWSPGEMKGRVNLYGSWGANETQVVEWMGGDAITKMSITATAQDIKLWWPNGMGPKPRELGNRPMYDIRVEFIPDDSREGIEAITVQDSRRIGFRHFALVTGNDTDPVYVQNATGQEGTEFNGMYYRVNGVAMWSRGANMIPMDALEGRLNAQAHVQVVESAALANMNTLRVWGGGMFLPSAWYDACDDYGVMVIQDQMYAQGGHDPKETETQEMEIRHNVRLLSHHPSIVIWDGCNECLVEMDKPSSIYATFVMRIVAEEDGSRSIWPSCPSNGWESGVDKLTSRPIPFKNLVTPKTAPRRIEVHGPYVHGGGFPAVNGNDHEPVEAKLPITIDPKPDEMGMAKPSVFASEFGTGGVMSSFESMSATLAPEHWSLHGGGPPDKCSDGFNRKCEGRNVMAQRNYPCDSIIKAYFRTEPDYFEKVGKFEFQRQLYHCMIAQALHMKSIIEERRSKNELGHLVWQLNEIWPTGGWGSLEYGNGDMEGQIIGGRWKPLHYFYRQSVFTDVVATCNGAGVGYIRNDAAGTAFHGGVVIHVVSLETGVIVGEQKEHKNITLAPGPGSLKVFECPIVDGSTHFLSIDVLMYGQDLMIHNSPILLKPPKDLSIQVACNSGLNWTIVGIVLNVVTLEITASVPVALLVMLTTEAAGRFSDNAFTLIGGRKIVHFHPFGKDPVDVELLKATLRIEDMAMYQFGQCQKD